MLRSVLLLSVVLLVAAPMVWAERIATSGSFVVDLDDPPGDVITSSQPGATRANALVNPGFETGDLSPWTTSNWTISTDNPHEGSYCAYDIGNYWIRQDFDPIDVTTITEIGTWHRQPEVSISAIDLFYSPTDYDEFLIFLSGSGWEYFDVTSELRPSGQLQAIRIYGYSGGGPDPDETFIDDLLIDVEGGTPAEEGTWGQVKALFR